MKIRAQSMGSFLQQVECPSVAQLGERDAEKLRGMALVRFFIRSARCYHVGPNTQYGRLMRVMVSSYFVFACCSLPAAAGVAGTAASGADFAAAGVDPRAASGSAGEGFGVVAGVASGAFSCFVAPAEAVSAFTGATVSGAAGAGAAGGASRAVWPS